MFSSSGNRCLGVVIDAWGKSVAAMEVRVNNSCYLHRAMNVLAWELIYGGNRCQQLMFSSSGNECLGVVVE